VKSEESLIKDKTEEHRGEESKNDENHLIQHKGKTVKGKQKKPRQKPKKIEEHGPVYQRYYHLFKQGELDDLVNQIPGVQILESVYDHDNWFMQIGKI